MTVLWIILSLPFLAFMAATWWLVAASFNALAWLVERLPTCKEDRDA